MPVMPVRPAALILALALFLAACSTQPQEDPMISSDQAKNDLVTLFDETAETIGGEWTVDTEFEGWDFCNFDRGVDGTAYLARRSAPPSDDLKAVAELVQADWESRGFEVTTRFTADPPLHEVIAHGPYHFSALFGSSAKIMILRGEGACVKAE